MQKRGHNTISYLCSKRAKYVDLDPTHRPKNSPKSRARFSGQIKVARPTLKSIWLQTSRQLTFGCIKTLVVFVSYHKCFVWMFCEVVSFNCSLMKRLSSSFTANWYGLWSWLFSLLHCILSPHMDLYDNQRVAKAWISWVQSLLL